MAPKRPTYEAVLEDASRLEPAEQERLIDSPEALVRRRRRFEGTHSITESWGAGKEIWRDEETSGLLVAQEYVNRERDSWDG